MEAYEEEVSALKEAQRAKIEGMDPHLDDIAAFEIACLEEIAAVQRPELAAFGFDIEQYVLGLDTVGTKLISGQDREFSEKERVYILDFVQSLRQNWEKNQIRILELDVQNLVLNSQMNEPFPEYAPNEELNELDNLHEKFRFVQQQIASEQFSGSIAQLGSFRVVKFTQIIQGLLYIIAIFFLLGYKKEQINVQNTNLLNWKHCQKQIIGGKEFTNDVLKLSYKYFTITNQNERG